MTGKQILGMFSGGAASAGSYLLGIWMGQPVTACISDVMGSVGWAVALVLFVSGALGINIALKSPMGGK